MVSATVGDVSEDYVLGNGGIGHIPDSAVRVLPTPGGPERSMIIPMPGRR